MVHIYAAHIVDRKNPWKAPLASECIPIILPYPISLGILVREGAALLPMREWSQPTIGL